MVQHSKTNNLDKIKILTNVTKNNKDRIDDLCKEFDVIDLKSCKGKLAE